MHGSFSLSRFGDSAIRHILCNVMLPTVVKKLTTAHRKPRIDLVAISMRGRSRLVMATTTALTTMLLNVFICTWDSSKRERERERESVCDDLHCRPFSSNPEQQGRGIAADERELRHLFGRLETPGAARATV